MPTINKEKLKEYLEAKNNPALAVFQAIQEIRKQVEDNIREFKKEAREGIQSEKEALQKWTEEKIMSLIEKKVADGIEDIIHERVSQNIFKGIEQIKGEKGEQGEVGPQGMSIIGPRGERGPQGIEGPIGSIGRNGKNGIDGIDGIDGKAPVRGIDYFTPEDKRNFIKDFVDEIKESLEMKKLLDKMNEFLKITEGLQRVQQFGGRTLHRGGLSLQWLETPSGAVNGVNKTFTLAYTPADPGKVMLFVNGAIQKKDNDFTISGSTITMTVAPLTDDILQVTYQNS